MGCLLLAWIKITRPLNGIIAGFGVLLGAICLHIPVFISPIIFCFLAMSLLAMAGNVHNDICDLEIDKINQPHRPLSSGKVSIIGAWFLTIALLGYSLAFAFLAGPLQFMATVLMAILLYLYNRYFKSWPLIGNFSVSLLCALAILFPGLGLAAFPLPMWGAVIFAFVFTLVREIIKDLEDQEGDRALGLKTFAILCPSPWNYLTPYFLWVILACSLPLSFIFEVYTKTFLVSSSIFVLLPSVVVFFKFFIPKTITITIATKPSVPILQS